MCMLRGVHVLLVTNVIDDGDVGTLQTLISRSARHTPFSGPRGHGYRVV